LAPVSRFFSGTRSMPGQADARVDGTGELDEIDCPTGMTA
jgi:hypothetical protein